MKLTIEQAIETCLVAIYSNELLGEKLFLKGGQALRFSQGLTDRFSKDADFSLEAGLNTNDAFFKVLEESLSGAFSSKALHLFDFKTIRKPKIRSNKIPKTWGGWKIEFKLIEKSKITLPLEKKRKTAIVPDGSESSKIKLDISEYEYCGSIEKVKVGSVQVKAYSRVLLILEKFRALCQQHPDYPLKETASRSRDFYDIERLWQKFLTDGTEDSFRTEGRKHINAVFKAKDVDLALLEKIFESSFLSIQERGWRGVRSTVSAKVNDFSYYATVLQDLAQRLRD